MDTTPWITLNEEDGVEVLAALETAAGVYELVGDAVMATHYRDLVARLTPA